MDFSSRDLSLLGLPYDVRFEIFSHMALPPFDGCQENAGLWLSCRQLREDVNREGLRRLRIYAQEVLKIPRKVKGDDAPGGGPDDGETHPSPELLMPASIHGKPVIGVNIPFLLIPREHYWHLHELPRRSGRHGMDQYHLSPGPERDRYLAEQAKRRQYIKQEITYIQRIDKLLGSIEDLHGLYAKIEIYLVANEGEANFATDPIHSQSLHNDERLSCIGLGKVLEVYMRRIRHQSLNRMKLLRDGRAFHATTLDARWDFGSEDPNNRREQDSWGSVTGRRSASYCNAQAEYTADRKEGSVQMKFDVKGLLVSEYNGTNSRIMFITHSLAESGTQDDSVRERQKEALDREVERLQKLSCPRLWGFNRASY